MLKTQMTMRKILFECRRFLAGIVFCLGFPVALAAVPVASANDYASVDAIFTKHCFDCHAAQDPEAKLVMESFDSLMKGGESGPVIISGKSSDSLLVQMIEGRVVRDGKQKIMPPGKRKKLEPAEIAVIKAWIDSGTQKRKRQNENKTGQFLTFDPTVLVAASSSPINSSRSARAGHAVAGRSIAPFMTRLLRLTGPGQNPNWFACRFEFGCPVPDR